MSEITNSLNNQLENNLTEKIIKDETNDRWFTGSEIRSDVEIVRDELTKLHIGLGDTVLVCLPNSAAYPAITQAIWEVGANMHPIAATTPKKELQAELNDHDYVASIVKDDLVDAVIDEHLVSVSNLSLQTAPELKLIRDRHIIGHDAQIPNEDDLALIMNTSGTTGKPKRVGLTHKILVNAVKYDIKSHKITPSDTTLLVMPMFHINAQAV